MKRQLFTITITGLDIQGLGKIGKLAEDAGYSFQVKNEGLSTTKLPSKPQVAKSRRRGTYYLAIGASSTNVRLPLAEDLCLRHFREFVTARNPNKCTRKAFQEYLARNDESGVKRQTWSPTVSKLITKGFLKTSHQPFVKG